MKVKLLFMLALAVMLVEFSSCSRHYPSGTPYKIWTPSGRTTKHYGAAKVHSTRHAYWGGHRYGPRPYSHRGRYRY